MKPTPWEDESIAANGRPVSENFKDWFAQSKVVDGQSRPLVVYHGTDAKPFSVFRPSRFATYGDGMYFTNSEALALDYGQRVEKFYLKINNPRKISEGESSDVEAIASDGYDGLEIANNDGSVIFVVARSEQIKSAVDNSGLFLRDSPDMNDQVAAKRILLARDAANQASQQFKTREAQP